MRLLVLCCWLAATSTSLAQEWTKLPALPDKEGFAGAFAGSSHGSLLVAGGANFPDKKPWEGGTKVWYDRVFVLDKPTGSWQVADKLPRALGYGVSVTHGNQVVCVGGSDAERHYADAFRLEWQAGKLVTTALPALPKPLANTCGALVGDVLYVAGGLEKPDASVTSKSVYSLDLGAAKAKWVEVEACPGSGRMLAVAGAYQGAFWLVGGVDLVVGKEGKPARKYLKDAYRYVPTQGWQRLADLPASVVAAPTPTPADSAGLYLLGGDDGAQVGSEPNKHQGFSKKILRYETKAARWLEVGELPASRVTVPCVLWNDAWVVPTGEAKPGIRSPEVWAFTPRKKG